MFGFTSRIKLLAVVALVALSTLASNLGAAGPIGIQERTLYVITVGVSKYRNPKMNNNVEFAAKDARDIRDILKAQKGRLYGRVQYVHLESENATKANILSALNSLKERVRPWDSVVVFLAGHGGIDAQGRYVFTPHEFDGNASQTGLFGLEVRAVLHSLPCTKMLILDTCHSSQAVHENRDTSIITFAACLPTEGSAELAKLQNGIFTRAFVQGMMGAADVNKDGVVTLAELDAYVCNMVPQFNGQQHPNLVRPATVSGSFQMALVGTSSTAVAHIPHHQGAAQAVALPPINTISLAPVGQ